MKKAAIVGKGRVALVDAPTPKAVDNQVVVKVNVAPMCSEYKEFLTGTNTDCLGHEAVGEVVEIARFSHLHVGDRVVAMPLHGCGQCRYCEAGDYIFCYHNTMKDVTMAQYILKPDFILKPIPDDLSDDLAALTCCSLGPSFGAYQRMSLTAFDTVLITGLGPVGLGAVANAKFRGAKVIAVESNPFRADLAQEIGADKVYDARDPELVARIKSDIGDDGIDCAVDCSGTVAAHRTCIDIVRKKGKVAFIGECHTETPIVASRDFIRKGITLFGSWHYNLNDFPHLIHMLRHFDAINRLISHRYPMSQLQDAFDTSASQQCAKILLRPWA